MCFGGSDYATLLQKQTFSGERAIGFKVPHFSYFINRVYVYFKP
jgi:hypothetical protein